MIALGADVYYFDERPITKSYQKALLKVNPNIFSHRTERYFFNILEKVKDIKFDYVFFLKCEMPTIKVMKTYRNHFKESKFCLYMWDSLSNVVNIEKKLSFFDDIYSFDVDDSKRNDNINFRPLFYADDFQIKHSLSENFTYDLCFLGTIHSDRYKVISQVKRIAKKNNLKTFFFNFLQSRFMYDFYKLTKEEFKDTRPSDFSFDKMSSIEIADVVSQSKIVLDIQHPKQTGLTMRTIEMIGMHKKIITTNAAIKQYDFYNPNNISVIDREDVKIDVSFFDKPYEPLDEEIYYHYSLEAWVLEMLKE
ncbi:capsular biosynthesis protein CpsH [Streptococcus sp. CSL10205-OR2]|uniref:capsular biosynthesis protein CpsH n=1 Tax=Streptococcus sp. CSL10205-OR2 TaxID=2980558 RepID=UPI0021DB6C4B|nr:capsular biosynthesis protein CpsH [Streptococcus sp. CSL10205-OR2]